MAQLASNKICLAALASSKGGNLEGECLFVRSEQPSSRKLHLFTPDMQAKAFCTRCLCKHARKCPYDTGLG